MSQISVHNESSMATVHSSHATGGAEAIKHLAAVLKLLRMQDQLKMMVRLEPFVAWEANHVRYLAVISTRPSDDSRQESDLTRTFSLPDSTIYKESPEEVCILGIDVTGGTSSKPGPSVLTVPDVIPSTSAPIVPQKTQRSHSTVSPDQHQTIGSKISQRARKFLTLPKQKNQPKPVSPAPRMSKRPSISSSVTIKLDDLPQEVDENDGTVHIGLVLPVWADSKISLDGDGGFRIESKHHHHSFKPVSVQAMWSVLQTLLKASENAKVHHQLSSAALGPRHHHASISTNYLSTTTLSPTGMSTSSHSSSMTTVTLLDHHGPGASHGWVSYYSSRIDSRWVNHWHVNLDEFQHCSADLGETMSSGQSSRRPLSPHMSQHRQQAYSSIEMKIRQQLREVMLKVDLEQVNSKEIRQRVETNLGQDLGAFKSFIDHEILVILGQMDAASEIFDFLYLGTEWNASNLDELREKEIGLVVNVTTEINNSFPAHFDYKNIRVNDVEEEQMLNHWEEAFRSISEAKKENKRVLVHCKMGVSRSASVVIAYAMKANDWNLQQALEFVKNKRSCVQPNPGFLKQLTEYEGMLLASKNRSSFQSLSSSTLSLCETRSRNSNLDIFNSSTNLGRGSAECSSSTPNLLAPSLPQRTESLRLSSRPAKFYLENSDDEPQDMQRAGSTNLVKKNSRKSRPPNKWDPIEEVAVKDDSEDLFGMLRVVVDTPQIQITRPDQTVEKNRSVSLSEDYEVPVEAALKSSGIITPKVGKNKFSRFSFGLSNAPTDAPSPAKENKYRLTKGRPASIHVSSYSKPKDPVHTLVKYFDEMTRTPHSHVSSPSALQTAQV